MAIFPNYATIGQDDSHPLLSSVFSLSNFVRRHSALHNVEINCGPAQLEVLICLHPVAPDAVAIEVQQSKIVAALACAAVVRSVLTSCATPLGGLNVISRDTFGILVHLAQHVLCIGIALLRRFRRPSESLREVLLDSFAALVSNAQP